MWQIIGAGAIGCLWAANLYQQGEKVRLITRRPIKADFLLYQDLQAKQWQLPIKHGHTLLKSTKPILVCVKAPQVCQAIQAHKAQIHAEQVIILMHNGMGCAEQVQKILPNNPIICATTANASLLQAPFNIRHTGNGVTYLGPFNQQAKAYQHLVLAFENALGDCHWCDDINSKLWLKLLINIAINPLTAIHQINNGGLRNANMQRLIKDILKEAFLVIPTTTLPMNAPQVHAIVTNVIELTQDNYSSMNRDIYFKRNTENEYINGYLLKKATQKNIVLPTITRLYQKIKALEESSLVH
ncbi:2-dehydropantoate 2-reductase [Psychromonas sp. CNPT3]|uniref:ketopantoate reductase family protein n=1 Tax=Psychromonas sp. CNPT3 TaxID=314282 RepID=UPI00006E990D|nr:2-dehydropantoate 2-reductase [Psychromonas sp. CNPT3]AGH81380.1 2-dehydropantoate 2-reductase [Psychromonas sp. CNPT3]